MAIPDQPTKSAFWGPTAFSLILGAMVAVLGVGFTRQSALREVAAKAQAEAETASAEARRAANRGERARDEAEALAGFVLDDLRDDLAAIGRSDLLARAAEQAAGYFDRLPAELVTEASAAEHASVLETLAQARLDLGDLDGALGVMQKSVALRAKTGGLEYAHATNELGVLHNARGERDAAREAFLAVLSLAAGMVGEEWEHVRVSAEFGIADTERAAGNWDGALTGYGKVREATAGKGSAEMLQVLMNTENNAGLVYQDMGDQAEAEAAYVRALAAQRELIALEPGVRRWEKELATTLNNLGTLLDEQKKWERAEQVLSEALRLRKGLVSWDSRNTRWLSDLTNSQHNLAMLHLETGNVDTATKFARAALASNERLILIDPENASAVGDLKEISRIYRRNFVAGGHPEIAESLAGETVEFIKSLRDEGADAGGAWDEALLGLYYDLGRIAETQGAPGDAAELRRKRAAVDAKNYASGKASEEDRYRLALLYSELGQTLHKADRNEDAAQVYRLARFILQEQVTPGFYKRDLFLDEIIRGERIAGTSPAIALTAGSEWRYWDSRRPPPEGWNLPAFDDSNWKSGAAPLGYGNGDEATAIDYGGDDNSKNITAYFRKKLRFPPINNLFTVGIRRDDGAVIYLNGEEIVRDGLPEGLITPTTFAAMTNKHGEEIFRLHTFAADHLPLIPGEDTVVAVEVHQNEPESSDLAFDLEIVTDFQLPPPGVDLDLEKLEKILGDALPEALLASITERK